MEHLDSALRFGICPWTDGAAEIEVDHLADRTMSGAKAAKGVGYRGGYIDTADHSPSAGGVGDGRQRLPDHIVYIRLEIDRHDKIGRDSFEDTRRHCTIGAGMEQDSGIELVMLWSPPDTYWHRRMPPSWMLFFLLTAIMAKPGIHCRGEENPSMGMIEALICLIIIKCRFC